MASKNEAKIKFSAETKEFDSAIKSSKNEIKNASQEIKLAAAEFRNTGDAAEYYQRKHDALERKLAAVKEQQEALNAEIEIATDIYGEGSDEVEKLESQLKNTEIAEQNLINQIDNCNESMEEQQNQAEYAESALGQLETTIEEQTSELEDLKEAYVNAYLEYGPMSDEAQALAGQIEDLSGSLRDNQDALEEAQGSANALDQTMEDVGDESGIMSDLFGGAFGKMANAVITCDINSLLENVVTLAKEIGTQIIESAEEWQQACDTIAAGTGATGEELDSLTESMKVAYQTSRNTSDELNDIAAIGAQVSTLFGGTEDEVTNLTAKISEYSGVVGTNGVDATSNLYQITKLWGEEAGGTTNIMDKLTYATQTSGTKVETITGILTDCHAALNDMGMGFDEAVGFIVSYALAGGKAENITRALQAAESNLTKQSETLAEQGLNVSDVFGMAIETAGQYTTTTEALNAEIGNTGIKVSDVFGTGKPAQRIIDIFTNGKMATEEYTEAVKSAGGQLALTVNEQTSNMDRMKMNLDAVGAGASEFASNFMEDMLNVASNGGLQLQNTIQFVDDLGKSILDAMTSSGQMSQDMQTAFANVAAAGETSIMNVIGSLATGKISVQDFAAQTGTSTAEVEAFLNDFEANYADATGAVTGFQEQGSDSMGQFDTDTSKSTLGAITSTALFLASANANIAAFAGATAGQMKATTSNVEEAMRAIQASANFSWALPALALPHFSVSGAFSVNPPSVPTFGVSWYAKGGLIMDGAQIFGLNAATGQFMGGGEAGPEAILPIDLLMDYITDAITGNNVQLDYDELGEKVAEAVSKQPITLEINKREVGRAFR